MEQQIERFASLRTSCRKALPIYGTDGSDSRCGKDAVSYRFTDLLSYCRIDILHRRFTAMCLHVGVSTVLQIFDALCLRTSNELQTYGNTESIT